MAEDDDSKTEDPSSRKLEEARQKGQVVMSREVASWFKWHAARIRAKG